MTKTSFLASYLLLFKVNVAVDDGNRDFFFYDDEKRIIIDCFNAVLEENIDDECKMPPNFYRMIKLYSYGLGSVANPKLYCRTIRCGCNGTS